MSFFRPEIEAIAGYTPGEQPQDGSFIKLNTNENPYPPSPAVAEAIRRTIARLPKYPHPFGDPFRQKAAEHWGVEPEWILCGNGSDDILTIVTRTLVGAGEMLRLPYPSYILYRTLAQLQGANYEEVDFNADWTLPDAFSTSPLPLGEGPEELQSYNNQEARHSCLAEKTGKNACPPDSANLLGEGPRVRASALKLVFLANPNSPSGTIIPPEIVIEIAERLPCPLLVDEAYADFSETNCMSLVKQCEKIMVSRSFSKSYALAGLRFGYLVAQPQLIEQFVKMKDSYNCDALSVAAATAALGDREWTAANWAKIRATRSRLVAEMRKLGFVTVDSQANFVWNTRTDRPIRPFYEELKRRRILVRYMDYPGWGDGLRISVGTDEEIDRCLEELRKIV
jgi:histidinol-phosphate aminotransferase